MSHLKVKILFISFQVITSLFGQRPMFSLLSRLWLELLLSTNDAAYDKSFFLFIDNLFIRITLVVVIVDGARVPKMAILFIATSIDSKLFKTSCRGDFKY